MFHELLVAIGLRAPTTYTMAQIVANVRSGMWTVAEAARITRTSVSIIQAQLATQAFLAGGAGATGGAVATGTTAAGTTAAVSTLGAILIIGGLVAGTVVAARVAGNLWAERSVKAGTRDPSTKEFTPTSFSPNEKAYTQRYYIYAVDTSGWSLYIGRPAEVEGRAANSFQDGGTADVPVKWKKVEEKEFYSEADARTHLKTLATSGHDSVWTGHHVKVKGQEYRDVHVGKVD